MAVPGYKSVTEPRPPALKLNLDLPNLVLYYFLLFKSTVDPQLFYTASCTAVIAVKAE